MKSDSVQLLGWAILMTCFAFGDQYSGFFWFLAGGYFAFAFVAWSRSR